MEASSQYNIFRGSIILILFISILSIYYLPDNNRIDNNLFFVIVSILAIIIYIILDNIYIKYYLDKINTKVKKYVIDNDRFYDTKQFEIFNKIRSEWKNIANEAMNVYKMAPLSQTIKRDYGQWKELDNEFENKVINNYGWIKAWSDPNTKKNNNDGNDKWLNYGFYHYGKWFEENAKKCPITFSLLNEIKDRINIAGFSLMKGISKIDKHTDTTGKSTNSLAYHLGLVVPEPPNSCILNVDGYEISQKNGQDIIFDSNYEHYAMNDSSYDRIILYIDFKL
jgi:aspartyl/asparaginyl beta-hydroxylase (cupin superfamily)